MTTLNEGRHAAEFILSEADRKYCREMVTILSGEGQLSAGTVIGRVYGAVSTAFTGTGNGAITMDATSPKLSGVQGGAYKAVCIEPAAGGGMFEVSDPLGVTIGTVAVGATFAKQIKFVIADGATDFSVGDMFTITVAAGSKWRSADPTNADGGSGTAAGILVAGVDATSADAQGVALVRGPAQVNGNCLVYDAAVDDDTKKATKIAELAALVPPIIVR